MFRSLIAALLLFSFAAFASDLKYARTITDDAGTHRPILYYFQGQRVRIDHRSEFGYDWKDGHATTIAYGPRMATIYQCDMHRVLELDFDHHQYIVTELDRSGRPLDASQTAAAPERSTGAKVKVDIDVRDTGETKQIMGHTARHFITTRKLIPSPGACSTAQETVEDGWYIDLPPRAASCQEMNQPETPRVANAVLTAGKCHDDFQIDRSGPTPPPFPVEVKVTTRETVNGDPKTITSTHTVTDLSTLPLDPQLFDLPTGYKHVKKLDNSPNLPWLLRGRLMWQNVKSTVWGWTPWGR